MLYQTPSKPGIKFLLNRGEDLFFGPRRNWEQNLLIFTFCFFSFFIKIVQGVRKRFLLPEGVQASK